MQFFHPLMHDNFTEVDYNAVKKLLKKKKNFLTQSKFVELFEKKWSKWLGVKYSVFVNSGSSANLLTIAQLSLNSLTVLLSDIARPFSSLASSASVCA